MFLAQLKALNKVTTLAILSSFLSPCLITLQFLLVLRVLGLKESNPQRQEMERWSPGPRVGHRGGGQLVCNGCKVSGEEEEKVLELGGGDDCTII